MQQRSQGVEEPGTGNKWTPPYNLLSNEVERVFESQRHVYCCHPVVDDRGYCTECGAPVIIKRRYWRYTNLSGSME